MTAASLRRRAWKVLRHSVLGYFADDGIFLASGLAFDLLLCMVPLMLIIVSVLGYAFPDTEKAMAQLASVLDVLAPESQKVVMDNAETIVANRGFLGILGFVLFFAFGSLVFGSARLVLNKVFRAEQRRGFLKGKGVDFLVMLATGLLLMLAIATSWLLSLIRSHTVALPELEHTLRPGFQVLGDLSGFVFTFLLFYLLYRYLPARTVTSVALVVASLTSAGLFHVSKWGVGLYAQFAQSYAPVYGALGGLMFFFLWLYYACTVFILGAEVGRAYDEATGVTDAAGSA